MRDLTSSIVMMPGLGSARRRRTSAICSSKGCTGRGRLRRPQSAWSPPGGGLLQPLEAPPGLPHWLSESDIDVYAGEFRRTGFAGGLNGDRNIDRNWELPDSPRSGRASAGCRCHAALCASSIAPHPTRSPCYSRLIRFWTVGGLRLNRLSGARYSSWMSSLLHCSTRHRPFLIFHNHQRHPGRPTGPEPPSRVILVRVWVRRPPARDREVTLDGRAGAIRPVVEHLEAPNIEPQHRLDPWRAPGGPVGERHPCSSIVSTLSKLGGDRFIPPLRAGSEHVKREMRGGTCPRTHVSHILASSPSRAASRPRPRRFPSARRDASLRTQRRPPRRIGGRPRARATDRSVHPPGR